MRSGWVWLLLSLQAAVLLSAAPATTQAPIATTQITAELRATLTRDYEIAVSVKPHAGDAWTRLARRITGDAANWEEIAALNEADQDLKTGQTVRVPFTLLRAPLQREIIRTLFPQDQATPDGWRHLVVGSRGVEGESLWKIAEWFTGDGANYSLIRKANPAQGLSTRKGDVILVPKRLLTAAFGGGSEEENAPKTAAEVRKEDDATQRAAADENVPEATLVASLGQPSLTYERYAAEPHAVYRLQKGEALYSSVAIRFTGRVYAKDVRDVVDRIVKFNEIDDVSKIHVGHPVKIPMDLLLPEYLPKDDPERLAQEATRRESARVAKRTRAAGLSGIHVILDAGHGGSDPGTEHDDVWESTYVYDVACRLKKILEKRSQARVSMTTKSKKHGFSIVEKNVLAVATDHYVQTTPKYPLDDAIVGVNLRWYLANSMFRRAMKDGATREKVVFLSIHADSLHPSLRGAMAYVPGASFVTGTYRKKGDIYLARAEVREQPRWYLANSMFRRAMKDGATREKVVFLSIHADSLHPSLRGAMAYVPGASFVTGTYRKKGDIYLARAEVREQPTVSHSRRDALVAEGLSREMAESVMESFARKGLRVHPFEPVRDNVIRRGREWVPAIIRHNQVPTRMLLEVCNLGNRRDRELIQTRKYRQQLAEAIYAGITDFYAGRDSEGPPSVLASGSK